MANARVFYATIFFILVMVLVFVVKPKPLFSEAGPADKVVTPFGFDGNTMKSTESATLFSLGVVTILVAVISMFIFGLIDVVYPPTRP